MAEVSRAANTAQAQRWNGEGGRFWIANRERHLAGHRRLLPHLFSAAGILPGERVLDVGCGCGATTIAAARAARGMAGTGLDARLDGWLDPRLDGWSPGRDGVGSGGIAVGLDLSAPMLQVARRLAAEAGAANVAFVQGDAQICPLRRDSWDVMISSFGVMFFDDPVAAFAGIAAALRRHGRLAFLCWQHDLHNELFSIALRAFGAYTPLPGPAASDLFFDPPQVAALLSSAGWENIQIDPIVEPAWMGSDVADVMSYVRDMPMIASIAADLGNEALTERVLATVAAEYLARQRPDGVWVRAAAWLVTAQRA